MKILLANPPSPFLRCRWDIKIDKTTMKYYPFPVRLSYATAVLKREGYDAHILDATAEELNREQFIEKFKKINPDVLVWETTASSFDHDKETMEMLKRIKPNLIVAASGYHATPTPGIHLENGYDYVIVGECDYATRDLVRYLNGETKSFPKGVASRNHKFIPRELIGNLDELPWPERDELPMRKYNDPKLRGFNIVMISSRGCPNSCPYCTVPVYYQKSRWRGRDPKDVVDEMEFLQNKYKPDELYFDDDNMCVNEEHVFDICDEVLDRNLKVNWNCMANSNISFELMKRMKEAGCTGITIGPESADPKILKYLAKGTQSDIINFARWCKKLNLRSHVCWVLGLPLSTKESDLETIKFAINLPSDTLQFSICVPYYGTRMYEWAKRNNYLATTELKDLAGNKNCVMDRPGYSHEEVEENLRFAKRQWRRKMLSKRPDILFLHLENALKYQGIGGALRMSMKALRGVFA